MKITQETIEHIYKKSLVDRNDEDYLKYIKEDRGLDPEQTNWGYISYFNQDGISITSCIIFPIFNAMGVLQALEWRSILHKDFGKIFTEKTSIPLYNIDKAHSFKTVIVTESIICAETLKQNGIENVISVLKAQTSPKLWHYICALFDNIILLYDNDSTGIASANKVVQMIEGIYPNIDIDIFDYIGGDVNEVYLQDRQYFKKEMLQQLKLINKDFQ